MNQTTSGTKRSDMPLGAMYGMQLGFQSNLLRLMGDGVIPAPKGLDTDISMALPVDDVEWFKYHMMALSEEAGEILQGDKRWKTHRNQRYERTEKLEELADAFITLMNVGIYSGFDAEEITGAIMSKVAKNLDRLTNMKTEKESSQV